MLIVFCSDPFDPRRPDEAYADEAAAVREVGGASALINYEALVDGLDPVRSVRGVESRPEATLALYRGWMLRPTQYERLFVALAARNVHLINDPTAYQYAHYLPESYAAISARTPISVWLRMDEGFSIDRVMELLRPFGDRPVIVKDFVKSQKHRWFDACYIPSAADWQAVERVVRRFLDLQGPDLEEGLVFREFVELEPLTAHPRSGMPLTQEYRTFYLDGTPLVTLRYWDEAEYAGTAPSPDLFSSVARNIRSRFFTMDVARRRDGAWIIVELGDGQVAGLPDSADPRAFYVALKERWPEEA